MHKKLFPILFIFLISFFTIGSVKAEGYFTGDDGSTGNVLTCIYEGTDGMGLKHSVTLLCERRNDKKAVSCSAYKGPSTGNLDSINSWVNDNKTCPTAAATIGTVKNKSLSYKVYYGSSSNGSVTRERYNSCVDKNGGACGTMEGLGAGATTKGQSEQNRENTASTINTCFCYWDELYLMQVSDSKSDAKDTSDAIDAQIEILNKYAKDKNESQTQSQFTEFDDGCGILGDDIAYFLRKALFYALIIGIVLTIVLGTIDFIRAVTGMSDDGMKKAWQRFIKRIIALAVLIILPALVVFILTEVDITGVNEDSVLCDVADE